MAILDLGINYGASYSLNFATDIISNRAGVEQRRALYQQPLLKVAIGNRMVNKEELDYLLAFFEAAQGRLNEFEIRDWTDYQVTDGTLGPVIEGRQSVIKTYSLGGETIQRLLTAVVEETIVDDGGAISCEFNVPVRFDQDAFPLSFEAYSPDGERLFNLQELTCTEVRKVWPEAPLQVPPASIDADLGIGKDYGTTGGLNYSTAIMALPSGWDDRQSNYSGSKSQWNIGAKVVNVAEMTRMITMFRLCRGQLVPFNFYDWQTETWQLVRFNTDSLGLQFEAHDENYYGENIGDRESLFALNSLSVKSTGGDPGGGSSGGGDISVDIDNETYIITIYDSSGSMSEVLAPLTSAIDELRNILITQVYGTEETANKYVKPVIRINNERWVSWLAEDYRDNPSEPEKYLFLIFINEAFFSYHRNNPRNLSLEPTELYLSDHAGFNAVAPNYAIINTVVFVPTPSPPGLQEIAFTGHLTDAINANNGYPPFNSNVFSVPNWPINATGQQIFNQIVSFLL
jgi:hypothetical protein